MMTCTGAESLTVRFDIPDLTFRIAQGDGESGAISVGTPAHGRDGSMFLPAPPKQAPQIVLPHRQAASVPTASDTGALFQGRLERFFCVTLALVFAI